MATIGVPLNIGQLPYTCYPSDPQSFYADMFSRASALYPQITGVIISDNTPAASDRDKLWIKTSAGAPVVGLAGQYVFYNGAWLWPHLTSAGSPLRLLWLEDLTALQTFDGGDTNPAGIASGPMWEEDTTFRGRSPMHPGAIPDDGSVLGVDGTYGVGVHTLTTNEIPSHTHDLDVNRKVGGDTGAGGQNIYGDATVGAAYTLTSDATGGGLAHPNVHPVRGIYLIKRSSRIYYKGG